MDKPAQEQIEKFWEWCGLTKAYSTSKVPIWVTGDNAIVSPTDGDTGLPIIDLSNLFQYAVPKVQDGTLVSIDFTPPLREGENWLCSLGYSRLAFETVTEEGITEALALFWALYKVMDEVPETPSL